MDDSFFQMSENTSLMPLVTFFYASTFVRDVFRNFSFVINGFGGFLKQSL